MPTKQLRCMPSIKESGQGFRVNLRHRSGSYDSCINFSVVCCSSSLKALLSENIEKEDFSESTIEDIKGWCEKSHCREKLLLSCNILSEHETSNCPFESVKLTLNVFYFQFGLHSSWWNLKQYNTCVIQSLLHARMHLLLHFYFSANVLCYQFETSYTTRCS